MQGRPPRTLRTICSLWDFILFLFVPFPTRSAARPARCGYFSSRGGGGDQDLNGEGDRRLCCLSFSFSFCFRLTLLGAGSSISEVVAAWVLSSLLSYWYGRGDVYY